MSAKRDVIGYLKKIPLQTAVTVLLLLLAAVLLWTSNSTSRQAMAAIPARVRFEGEYRIADGSWEPIKEGVHIPATKGDVTLRGNFLMYAPNGEYVGIFDGDTHIALYTDHINLTIYEGENEPLVMDCENPVFGDSACGETWTAHRFTGNSTGKIEISVHNPHCFGNEMAVDELLSNMAFWGDMSFERGVLNGGKLQRNAGLLFVVAAFILLGIALFSVLTHDPNNRIVWLLGLTSLSAGGYFAYGAQGVSFWNESIVTNTTMLGLSMMFYMLFVSEVVTSFLQKTKRIGRIMMAAVCVVDGACFLIPALTDVLFYDTWGIWAVAQTTLNIGLLACLTKELVCETGKKRWICVGVTLPMVAFELDVAATALGWWKGGYIGQHVFVVLFAVALIVVLRIVLEGINVAAKARELEVQSSRLEAEKNKMEAELKESRIAIMLSQIRPHFIYNTLGTIERMCLKDPQKAFDLVRNFSLYLRGNFSELDSLRTIRFAEELKHVEYYVNIEKVRFPDMQIEYDVKTTDFVLPALSVQPLVENAIKHGLMRLETGGTVVIRSYETPTHFCVEVEDDGVGFDTSLPIEEKKH
ncbi:MAG: histidine kinase, partial [Oscillospiraceae bacterium]|nr:histidine kinase [Oscillospiraceae bacterium]